MPSRLTSTGHTLRLLRALALLALAGTLPLGHAAPATHPECRADGTEAVARLHRDWVLVGWEKKPGDPPFVFRQKLAPWYDFEARDLLLYDDFDPQHRVARTADQYGEIWNAPFNALSRAQHRVVSGPEVMRTGPLAASQLTFAARLVQADGGVVGIRTTTSLVWRCGPLGWKIAREHNSSVRVDAAALRALMGD